MNKQITLAFALASLLMLTSLASAAYYTSPQVIYQDSASSNYQYSDKCASCNIKKSIPVRQRTAEIVHVQLEPLETCRTCIQYRAIPSYKRQPEIKYSFVPRPLC